MHEKKHNFRYSAPIKPKQIVLFKRSRQNVNNHDDVSLQISKALNCSLSNSDTMNNTIELLKSNQSSNMQSTRIDSKKSFESSNMEITRVDQKENYKLSNMQSTKIDSKKDYELSNLQSTRINSKKSYEDFIDTNIKIKELDRISKNYVDTKIINIEPVVENRKADSLKKSKSKHMSIKKFKKLAALNLDRFDNKIKTLISQNKRLIAENDKLNLEINEFRTKESENIFKRFEIEKERDVLKNENMNLIKLYEDYKLGIGSTIDVLKENLTRINLEKTNLQNKNESLIDKYNIQKLFLVKEVSNLDYIISTLDIDYCIKIYNEYIRNVILNKNITLKFEIYDIVDQVDKEILGISNIFKDISSIINIERSKIIFEIDKCVNNIREMEIDFIELKNNLKYKEMKIKKLKKKYRRYKNKFINKSKNRKKVEKSTISDTDIWDCFK